MPGLPQSDAYAECEMTISYSTNHLTLDINNISKQSVALCGHEVDMRKATRRNGVVYEIAQVGSIAAQSVVKCEVCLILSMQHRR